MTIRKDILWVDDDEYLIQFFTDKLEMRGHTVRHASNVREAKEAITAKQPDLVIIDVMMPTGEDHDSLDSHGGFRSGLVLAKWITQNFPQVTFIGCSNAAFIGEVPEFFEKHGAGFIHKLFMSNGITDRIERALGLNDHSPIATFIVHGHDDTAKLELKNYIQNTLRWPEPTILHEQPSLGRTVIEKFEDEARKASVVFVLLTPDDKIAGNADSNATKRRSRQNVIFEMGYFLGVLGRQSGRVLLLHKGPLELPSDLSGVVYIDISHGIASAGEEIRREVQLIKTA